MYHHRSFLVFLILAIFLLDVSSSTSTDAQPTRGHDSESAPRVIFDAIPNKFYDAIARYIYKSNGHEDTHTSQRNGADDLKRRHGTEAHGDDVPFTGLASGSPTAPIRASPNSTTTSISTSHSHGSDDTTTSTSASATRSTTTSSTTTLAASTPVTSQADHGPEPPFVKVGLRELAWGMWLGLAFLAVVCWANGW
jgi:hypothetical protein